MMVVTHEMGFARKSGGPRNFMDEGKIVEDSRKTISLPTRNPARQRFFLAKILH